MASPSGKKDKAQPPKSQDGIPSVILEIRETLYSASSLGSFANRIKGDTKPAFPWSNFIKANQALKKRDKAKAIDLLKQIVAADGLGTRLYLQAWHSLRSLGELPPEPVRGQIQGFIMENHMAQGLDLLAAYADHTARYWTYTGAGLVWDTRDPEIDLLIDKLLTAGQEVMEQAEIEQNEDLPVPPKGNIRLFMMSYDGFCFGEGPYMQFIQNPIAGYAISAGNNLIGGLLEKAKKHF